MVRSVAATCIVLAAGLAPTALSCDSVTAADRDAGPSGGDAAPTDVADTIDAALDDADEADVADATDVTDVSDSADATDVTDARVEDADDGGPAPLCTGAVDMTPSGGVTLPMWLNLFTPTTCGSPPLLWAFTLDEPTQATMWSDPSSFDSNGFRVDATCGTTSIACGTSGRVTSRLLAPGRHYFALDGTFYGSSKLVLETPPPAPTNTTCTAATPLVDGVPLAVPRIVDGQPRVYSFQHTGPASGFTTSLSVDMEYGACGVSVVHASVRRVCDDGATEIVSASASCSLGEFPAPLTLSYAPIDSGSITPPGQYYLVISADLGAVARITYHVRTY